MGGLGFVVIIVTIVAINLFLLYVLALAPTDSQRTRHAVHGESPTLVG